MCWSDENILTQKFNRRKFLQLKISQSMVLHTYVYMYLCSMQVQFIILHALCLSIYMYTALHCTHVPSDHLLVSSVKIPLHKYKTHIYACICMYKILFHKVIRGQNRQVCKWMPAVYNYNMYTFKLLASHP